MTAVVVLALAALPGCGGGTSGPPGDGGDADAGSHGDALAEAPPDAPPDVPAGDPAEAPDQAPVDTADAAVTPDAADAPDAPPEALPAEAGDLPGEIGDSAPPAACGPESRSGERWQYVVDSLLLPTDPARAAEYAFDLDGNGSLDNALGRLLAAVGAFGSGSVDPQEEIDRSIADGRLRLGLQLWADALDRDDTTALAAFLLVDGDAPPDPRDDFSGHEAFDLDPASPTDSRLCGPIAAGAGTWGPGTVPLRLAMLPGVPPLALNLVGVRMRGAVSASRLGTATAPAVLGGAIAEGEIDAQVLPALAGVLDRYASGSPCDMVCEVIRSNFDLDGDGHVTAAELRLNPLVAGLLAPDVRIDGTRALSLGLALTALPAVIRDAPAE